MRLFFIVHGSSYLCNQQSEGTQVLLQLFLRSSRSLIVNCFRVISVGQTRRLHGLWKIFYGHQNWRCSQKRGVQPASRQREHDSGTLTATMFARKTPQSKGVVVLDLRRISSSLSVCGEKLNQTSYRGRRRSNLPDSTPSAWDQHSRAKRLKIKDRPIMKAI